LGPLLFLAYIKDMPLEVKSTIALFADDAYLYQSINSQDNTTRLQKDIDTLVAWEEKWSMKFHPDKCQLLRVTNKRKIIKANYNTLMVNN